MLPCKPAPRNRFTLWLIIVSQLQHCTPSCENASHQNKQKLQQQDMYQIGYDDSATIARIVNVRRDEELLSNYGRCDTSAAGGDGEQRQTSNDETVSVVYDKSSSIASCQCPLVVDGYTDFKIYRSAEQTAKMYPWITDPIPVTAETKLPCDGMTRYSSIRRLQAELNITCEYSMDMAVAVRLSNGNYRVLYQVSWNGVPLMDGGLTFLQEPTGLIIKESVEGSLVHNVASDVEDAKPTLSPYDALLKAISHHGDNCLYSTTKESVQNIHSELMIVVMKGKAQLVYLVDYYVHIPRMAPPQISTTPSANKTGPNLSEDNHRQSTWWSRTSWWSSSDKSGAARKRAAIQQDESYWKERLGKILRGLKDQSSQAGDTDSEVVDHDDRTILNSGGVRRPFTVIDAHTGKVLSSWDGLFKAYGLIKLKTGNPNEKVVDYNEVVMKITQSLCAYKFPLGKHSIWLNDWTKSDKMSPQEFDCSQASAWHYDRTNGAQSPRNSAYKWVVTTIKFLTKVSNNLFNRDIPIEVHYDGFVASWTGSSVIFGDGGKTLYPTTTADIVSHEVGHAFTDSYSKLNAFGQPAAVNEAFSDMTAVALVKDVFSKDVYHIGKSVMKSIAQPLRDLCSPSKSSSPGLESAKDWTSRTNGHVGSGVFSKAFCLLSKAKGWSIQQAYQVFLDANMFYWRQRSGFTHAACGVIKAAFDLKGAVGRRDAIAAFRDVHVVCSG